MDPALAPRIPIVAVARPTPPLENGDRLTRAEFHRRYENMPRVKKAELIEGVVHMPSPVRINAHARPHTMVIVWLGTYEATTPGTESGDNGTVLLDPDNELQPDAFLRVHENAGGQSRVNADDYLEGAPELVVEIAASSASYDLREKKTAYRRNGVQEYLVWRVLDGELDWWRLVEGEYLALSPGEDGRMESAVFPGLRLDRTALLRGDLPAVLSGLREGLQGEAHAGFVHRLAAPR